MLIHILLTAIPWQMTFESTQKSLMTWMLIHILLTAIPWQMTFESTQKSLMTWMLIHILLTAIPWQMTFESTQKSLMTWMLIHILLTAIPWQMTFESTQKSLMTWMLIHILLTAIPWQMTFESTQKSLMTWMLIHILLTAIPWQMTFESTQKSLMTWMLIHILLTAIPWQISQPVLKEARVADVMGKTEETRTMLVLDPHATVHQAMEMLGSRGFHRALVPNVCPQDHDQSTAMPMPALLQSRLGGGEGGTAGEEYRVLSQMDIAAFMLKHEGLLGLALAKSIDDIGLVWPSVVSVTPSTPLLDAFNKFRIRGVSASHAIGEVPKRL
ncbi:unnamed protein product [Closterium sp. Yama58-4]|nr:unnamed protein product [Closterium sp. Yama58-4]